MVSFAIENPKGFVFMELHHHARYLDAEVRQLAGEQLERLGLAGAGGAGDEAVPVHRRQRDAHRGVGVSRAVDDRGPELERGTFEGVARADLVDL